VCQNLSVADSPSPLARQMRTTIGRELQAGRSPDQIRAGFVQSYGEWILLAPPRRGINLVAWVAPFVLLVVGVVIGAVAVVRWTAQGSDRQVNASPSANRVEARSGNGTRLSPDDRSLLEGALSALPEELA
jgi:cytochrome c-type biogenesis protein CcmH